MVVKGGDRLREQLAARVADYHGQIAAAAAAAASAAREGSCSREEPQSDIFKGSATDLHPVQQQQLPSGRSA